MKKVILSCLFGILTITACNQKNNKTTTENKTDTLAKTKVSLTDNFYKRLAGTIDGKPIVMNLQKNDDDFNGSYYTNDTWLELLTDTIPNKNNVILFENNYPDYYFDKELKQPRLDLKWTGNGYDGNWISGKKDKKLTINLVESYPEGSYAFDLNTYQDSIKAFPKKTKSPIAIIKFQYLLASKGDDNSKWINDQIKSIMSLKNGDVVLNGIKNEANLYLKDYQESIKDLKSADEGAWMNYSKATSQYIKYNAKGFVVINAFDDDYSGGAHGNYNSTLYCLDVINRKKITLNNVVKIDSNTLQKLVEKNFRKQYNIKQNEGINSVLFDNFLKPNKNFYFNANGIAFLYNPYEVASYAQGQIVVFIPYTDLKNYLLPDFAQRIGVK